MIIYTQKNLKYRIAELYTTQQQQTQWSLIVYWDRFGVDRMYAYSPSRIILDPNKQNPIHETNLPESLQTKTWPNQNHPTKTKQPICHL